MRAFPLIFVVAGLSVAGAVGAAWNNRRLAREAETTLEELARKRSALGVEIRRAEQRLAATASLRDRKEPDISEARVASAAVSAAVASSGVEAGRAEPPNAYTLMRQDPELQALRLAAERGKLATRYASLFRSLGLSPAEADRFCNNVLAREGQRADILAASLASGLGDHNDVVERLHEQAEAEHEKAQRALLGEGWRAAKDFERSLEVRDAVSGLAGTAVLLGVPLTAQQAEALTRIIVAAEPGQHALFDGDAVDWERIDAQAKEILSEAQLALLRTIETNTIVSRHSTRLTRAMDEARKAGATPGP